MAEGERERDRGYEKAARGSLLRVLRLARGFFFSARVSLPATFFTSSLPVPPHQTECVPLRRGRTHSRFSQFRMVRRTTHYRE